MQKAYLLTPEHLPHPTNWNTSVGWITIGLRGGALRNAQSARLNPLMAFSFVHNAAID
jgi:hypothetical protein